MPIIPSVGPEDSVLWLARLARRSLIVRPAPDRPVYAQRPAQRHTHASEAPLAAVPGISVVLARRLLERFGSVAGVIAAGRDEWVSVEGIGTVRTAALESTLLH